MFPLWLAVVIIFHFCIWLLILKTDKQYFTIVVMELLLT